MQQKQDNKKKYIGMDTNIQNKVLSIFNQLRNESTTTNEELSYCAGLVQVQ